MCKEFNGRLKGASRKCYRKFKSSFKGNSRKKGKNEECLERALKGGVSNVIKRDKGSR